VTLPYVNERKVKNTVQQEFLNPKDLEDLSRAFPQGLIAFDFETTGLSPLVDQAIEIGAVKVKNGAVSTFESFLRDAQQELPEDINESIHGISHKALENAPDRLKTLESFLDFCDGGALLAHNAKFDAGFLLFGLKRTQQKITGDVYCSHLYAKLVMNKKTPNFKLKTLADHYGINIENHHRALSDAITDIQVFAKLFREPKGDTQLPKSKLFSLEEFENNQLLPEELKIIPNKIKQKHIVEIMYSGGSHKNTYRPIRPISLLPMPDGPVLYAYCFLSNMYKSFSVKKIKELRQPDLSVIQKYGAIHD
jgi:DNA polymerase-3 subunit epsilon